MVKSKKSTSWYHWVEGMLIIFNQSRILAITSREKEEKRISYELSLIQRKQRWCSTWYAHHTPFVCDQIQESDHNDAPAIGTGRRDSVPTWQRRHVRTRRRWLVSIVSVLREPSHRYSPRTRDTFVDMYQCNRRGLTDEAVNVIDILMIFEQNTLCGGPFGHAIVVTTILKACRWARDLRATMFSKPACLLGKRSSL